MEKKLIIFTGPSGVGKGTVEQSLFTNQDLKLKLSVSITTRKPREGEIDGVHYYFVPSETFETFIEENKLLEYSKHFDNYYGTLYSEISNILSSGKIPFLEIETNGAKQIIEKYRKEGREDEICSIFLMPPSLTELERRIETRNTETYDLILKRLDKAREEIILSSMFKYVVVNNSIEDTVNKIKEIIKDNFAHIIEANDQGEAGRKA
ncbi:guanylate kinase [Mycoplasmopsis arginini]|uniref:Guanylate kinase n=2 Tax=Mycoplasmopsis arginini TaxID=2094 RepID=A0ABZ2AM33_MYCAR|nr:guanylate kinase [Mycoplasmopsis arginini]CRH46082.1 guanylate kinase [Chlamydia trachomatis]MDP4042805.1 guanylate kinase [Mycoplasmopsis arginini]WVN21957.1 guanylate kinase [Mycoplasmopsis arginini]CRH47596.1 guanylate kinase [Chlamydia trachomatis]CRH55236.1 guanylate kinase [Chlamydia trachomatis]